MASPKSSSVDLNSVSGSSEQGETVTNALSQLGRAQASNFARRRVVASNKGKKKTERGPGKTSQKKSTSLKYRKIPKISPGACIFQRPFLSGLFLEGLIFGGAYIRREICWKEIYRFCLFLLCI